MYKPVLEKIHGKMEQVPGLYTRDGSRYIHMRVRNPKTHERVCESTRTDNLAFAKAYVAKRTSEFYDEKLNVATKTYTFGDAAARFVRDKEAAEKKSLASDIQMLSWLQPHLNHLPLPEVTNDLVYELMVKKRAEGSRLRKNKDGTWYREPLSNSRLNRYVDLIRSIMNLATDSWKMMTPNDREKYTRYKEIPNPLRSKNLEPEQLERFVGELPINLRSAVVFGCNTGLRRANIVDMVWSQINLDRKIMTVPGLFAKNGDLLEVALNEYTLDVLNVCRTHPLMGAPAINPVHADCVFKYKGIKMKEICTKAYYKAQVRAGLRPQVRLTAEQRKVCPTYPFHAVTRHTWASLLRQNGMTAETLMELGGWKSPEMALRYAKVNVSNEARSASDSLMKILHLPMSVEALADADNDEPMSKEDQAEEAALENEELVAA